MTAAPTSLPRLRLLGMGMGPQHLTPEASEALRGCSIVLAARKRSGDPLLAVREEVCRDHDVPLVEVPDPERDRDDPRDYPGAVADWHRARVAAYAAELAALADPERPVGMLVWGDPALYDSSIRIAGALVEAGAISGYDVLPGISAPQLLAARHGIVLHEVGMPVHLTTARRLAETVEQGQRNIVVMLMARVDLSGLEDWSIWWGANLGASGEQLVSGRVSEVAEQIADRRQRAKAIDGWVMDLFLVRAGEAR